MTKQQIIKLAEDLEEMDKKEASYMGKAKYFADNVIAFYEEKAKDDYNPVRTRGKEMLEAAKPLMKWINENCHPHMNCEVTHLSVELKEGQCTERTEEFLKD